jgi:hypothetical protein
MSNLESLRELIQNDICTCVDSHIEMGGLRSVVVNRDKLKVQLCQIVVDRVNKEMEDDESSPL